MTEATIPAPAQGADSVSAPVPASAPASPSPHSSPSFNGGPVPSSQVDSNKFPIREDYAAALLTEKLGTIASPEEPLAEAPEPVEVTATTPDEEDFSLG